MGYADMDPVARRAADNGDHWPWAEQELLDALLPPGRLIPPEPEAAKAPKPPPPRSDPGDPYGDPMWGEMMRSFDAWWERRFGHRRKHDYRGNR